MCISINSLCFKKISLSVAVQRDAHAPVLLFRNITRVYLSSIQAMEAYRARRSFPMLPPAARKKSA